MVTSNVMNYAERLALRNDPDIQEQALLLEMTVDELLNLDVSRADKCSRPVVLTKTNLLTGESKKVTLPCGASDANKCAPCAEFSQRLRMRQIMNTIEKPRVETALFTLTAPSFGQVHRASWTEKDEYRIRKLPEHEKYVARLNKLHNKELRCPCGTAHEYDYDRIGTPLKVADYDYGGDVIWSQNLPRLMSSTKKGLRYIADSLGISITGEDAQLSMFAVFERQKRGSLHAHFLIAVRNNHAGFIRLVARLKSDWVSPTARIPNELANWYASYDAQLRLEQSGLDINVDVTKSLPEVVWRSNLISKGTHVIGTQFGEVYDIRILDAAAENSTELMNHKQAAAYVSKYLTKSQASFSPESLALKDYFAAQHFARFRLVAVALFSDKQLLEARRSFLRREIDRLESSADGPTVLALIDTYRTRLRALDVSPITLNPLADLLVGKLERESLSTSTVRDAQQKVEVTLGRPQAISLRSAKLRLNKSANNGGFSGALTSSSNWDDSLASLRRGMKEYYDSLHPLDVAVEEDIFAYELDLEAMENERLSRLPWLSRPDPEAV